MMEKKDRRSGGGGGGGRQRQMNQQPMSKQPGSVSNYNNGGNSNSNNNSNNNKDNNKGKNKGGGGKVADPRTLFVKFHPPSATVTRQHLSDHFSNYGPVNRCSVIRNQKKRTQPSSGGAGDNHDGEDDDGGGDNNNGGKEDRGSRGFGFVRFVNEEDARAAADAIRTKNSARGGGGGEIMVVDGARYAIRAERAADTNAAAGPPPRRGREETGRVSAKVVPPSSSSSNETTATRGSSLPSPSPKVVAATTGEPADATTVKDGKEDADAIYKAESKRKRTSRVIIRNLSFHATERHVRSAMEASFGPVASIDLPTVPVLPSEDDDNNKKDDGGKGKQRRPPVLPRHRGFAFVTFASAADARKAVAGSSGEGGAEVKIKNRPVAIDFSVSKMEHRRIAKEGGGKREEEEKSDSESVAEEGEEGEGGEGKDEDHDEEGGSEDEDDGSDSDSDGDDDDDDDEEEDDGDGKSEAEDVEDDDATAAPAREHDPTEARRTLFLRNVPFDATRHDVFDLFRKFGRVDSSSAARTSPWVWAPGAGGAIRRRRRRRRDCFSRAGPSSWTSPSIGPPRPRWPCVATTTASPSRRWSARTSETSTSRTRDECRAPPRAPTPGRPAPDTAGRGRTYPPAIGRSASGPSLTSRRSSAVRSSSSTLTG